MLRCCLLTVALNQAMAPLFEDTRGTGKRRIVHVGNQLRMAIVFFVIVVGFYWKLTLTAQFDWIWGPDLATQVLPWFQEQARQWNRGTFPLWDPYLWAGQPLIGQAQPGAAYPPNWILFALPLDNGQIAMAALQWYFVMIHLMAAAFCYWLCRDLARSRAASLVAGLAFGLGGFVGATGWPQMVNGALWLPLVFLFLLRATRGKNTLGNAALSGMFLGIAWLSGHHQIPMFTTVAVAGTWLYFITRQGRLDWRFARAAVAAFFFTGLSGALQILPAFEYGHLAKRWVGAPEPISWSQSVPYFVHRAYDLRPGNLLGLVFPNLKGHFNPFVGVVILALALIGVAACWRESRVRLMASVGLGGLLYALGENSVFQGFLYAAVPGLDKARSPSAAIVIFQFGAAVLASFGLDRLSSSDSSPWPSRVMRGVLAFGIFTLAVFQAVVFANKMSFPDDRGVMTAVVSLLLAALLFAWTRGALTRRQAGTLMVMLLLLELGNDPGYDPADRSDRGRTQWMDRMRANQDVAEFLKREPGFPRVDIAADAFEANWGAGHGIEMWGGSLASVTSNLLSFEFHRFEARMLYGVAYTIGANPTPGAGEEVFSGESGMKVYKQSAAFPRTWAIHNLLQVRDIASGNQLIAQHLSDFRHAAFMLHQPPNVESCDTPDGVALQEHREDRVLITASMSCKGMVVLSDTFYPGWRARVDGKSATIYEVNGAMRGIVVPAGFHTITLRYRPVSVLLGALLSFLGIGGATLLAAFRRTRKQLDA